MHGWHAARGARFVNAGLWKRPHSYPGAGESEDDAANREALNVRARVGVVDVSTLGKIELQGRDVVAALVDIDVSNAAFPFLGVADCRLRARGADMPARLFRMSYSGELAYEIHVPADRGAALWEGVMAAGKPSASCRTAPRR